MGGDLGLLPSYDLHPDPKHQSAMRCIIGEGSAAWYEHKTLDENPYPNDSEERRVWELGFGWTGECVKRALHDIDGKEIL